MLTRERGYMLTFIPGQTPLHLAAWASSADIFAELLRRGAEPSATDDSGRLPVTHVLFLHLL